MQKLQCVLCWQKVSQVGKLKVSSLIQYKNGSIYQAQRRSWIKIDVQKGKLVTKRYTDFQNMKKPLQKILNSLKTHLQTEIISKSFKP